jgi:hypothetical protein
MNYENLSDVTKAKLQTCIEKELVLACIEEDHKTMFNIIDNVCIDINKVYKLNNILNFHQLEEFSYNIDDSFSLLTIAVIEEHIIIVNKLLEIPNIDINAIDNYGRTALMRAVFNSNKEQEYGLIIIETLLNNESINVHIMDFNYISAIEFTIKDKVRNIIKKRMVKDFSFLPVPIEVVMSIMDFYPIYKTNVDSEFIRTNRTSIGWDAITTYPPRFGNDDDEYSEYSEYSDYN